MKIYVDVNYEVYTEETINEEIARTMEMSGYSGIFECLASMFTESELFAILPVDVQSEVFEDYKERIINDEFCEREIDDPSCPYINCPYSK